ncbi:PREDICTED: uncharacterized protein LOC105569853 [Vollenhovia emeryi]|uniref:uncharacterized protein LOC105569853 n=1 Tax=Vollenhovia emeryi TaxID=411798 RepID=UPI0005F39FDB|nr:PREDICTED: uncharacterized protein LOC105569853 [Vollenhovia emeryi]
MARFLHEILETSVIKPRSHIKDSWAFTKLIQNRRIEREEILLSLDVTALFNNIPKELVIKAIEKRWQEISQKTFFNLKQFLYATELVLSSTSFSFNGQFYEQIFGSPMGSPLSPILADLVMDDLETFCLEQLEFEVNTYYRYVDDVFTIIPNNKIDDILKVFNSYHPRLKFTHEIEKDCKINFLDVSVIRRNNTLVTNWFRKATFSGRYINYFSNHPHKYMTNIINNLTDRAVLLSDDSFHDANLKLVKEILTNNCFPTHVIDKHIKCRLKQLRNQKDNQTKETPFDPRQVVTIPYIKHLSDNISRTFKNCGIQTIFTVPKKLNNIIKKGKDRLPNKKQTELIYKINCVDCDACYIGQTKRHLDTRIKEHLSDIKKHDNDHSVVSKHRTTLGHEFQWSDSQILHKERNLRKREVAEMFFIKRHSSTINYQRDTESLPGVYEKIIDIT